MASIISQKSFKISTLIGLIFYISIQFLWAYFNRLPILPSFVFLITEAICLLISLNLIGNNLNYYRPQNFNFGFLVVWCVFFAAFSIYVPNWLINIFYKNNLSFLNYINNTIYIRLIFSLLMLLCFAAFCLIWYSVEENKENYLRKQEAQELNREAELFKLRQQLQPHFLFNSLNSINALIGSRPTEARKMIEQLSDFLRYTLKKEENQLVQLKDELLHLQLYLEIEKVRFGHRLNTNFDIEEAANLLLIPALLLQPILENAIKFGLYDTLETVDIEVLAICENNNLVLKIINPFDAGTSKNSKGTGFGLKSVKKRLQLLYFRSDLLKTSHVDNKFISEITIPQSQ